MRKWLANVALAFTVLVFLAYGLSAILWLKDTLAERRQIRMFQFDEKLGWRFVPGRSGPVPVADGSAPVIHTNREGYRDAPFAEIAQEAKRVAVLGDSFVTNIKVKEREIFTELLEKKFPGVSFMNFGVNGYGQTQEYLQLDEVLKYRPDLVLIMIYIENDFLDNLTDAAGWYNIRGRPYVQADESGQNFRIMPTAPPPSFFEQLHFPKPTRLYYFLLEKISLVRHALARHQPVEAVRSELDFMSTELMEIQPQPVIETSYRVMEDLLLKISDKCRAHNIPVFFLIAPIKYQVDEIGWRELTQSHPGCCDLLYTNGRLRKMAEKNGLRMLDLYPGLRRETLSGKTCYDPLEFHWTADGNRIVAEEIFNFLQNQPEWKSLTGNAQEPLAA